MRTRERKHHKLYWIDPGLVRAVKKQLGSLGVEECGALFEGWVHTLLRTYGQERRLWEDLAYWAPLQGKGVEVDFLLRRGDEFLALEVKASAKFSRSQLPGLKAIAELPGVVRRILLYTGTRELKLADDLDVWPVESFLEALAEDRLWP